jgi:hypothetical protein
MHPDDDLTVTTQAFVLAAKGFCSALESMTSVGREQLLFEVYRILPSLIAEAINLPKVESDNAARSRLADEQWTIAITLTVRAPAV